MRDVKIKNKYNLTISKIKKLKVNKDLIKEGSFGFWRNSVVNAWCISGTTIKNTSDNMYGTYNSYWLGIYDDGKIKIHCDCHGGMCDYNFNSFFREQDIENDIDLEIQEQLLCKVNQLIDNGVLIMCESEVVH